MTTKEIIAIIISIVCGLFMYLGTLTIEKTIQKSFPKTECGVIHNDN